MHPDRKIGIAMGILLVGVVAALFFRNEPLAVDEGLSSIREQELNQTLRDRDVSVYLDPDSDRQTEDGSDKLDWTLPELFDQVRSGDTVPIPIAPATPVIEPQLEEVREPRDPSRFAPPTAADRSDDPPTTPPDDRHDVTETNVPVQTPGTVRPPTGDYQEYEVKFGDTLSGIAQKFLGSHSRYREIYELNKDRMSSPDRLKVGRAIRVPRQHH